MHRTRPIHRWRPPIAPSSPTPNPAAETYASRQVAFAAERERIHRRWLLIANLRLVAFVVLGIALWQFLFVRTGLPVTIGTLAALAVVVGLVILHGRLRRERDRFERLATVNALAGQRLALAWDELPTPPADATSPLREPSATPSYSHDLNVTGRASLEQRIGTPATQRGWETLHRWLLAPADPATIAERQPAVRDLAAELDQRQAVETAAHREHGTITDPEDLIAWAEGERYLTHRPWLVGLAWIAPIVLIVALVAQVTDLTPWPFWLIPVTINVIVFQLAGVKASTLVARVAPLHAEIAGYRDVFAAISGTPAQSPLLQRIAQTLGDGEHGAMTQSDRLARASSMAIPRGSMLYFPFQMGFLWDIHVLHRLERWQATAGPDVRAWIDAAAEWEALAALSVLAHDHPAWTFPHVDPAADRFAATALAHPLIDAADAVANDVEVGPRGTFLFVTGSNMSGKSTLLRAVGANAVLAQAGGPVAASTLTMPVVEIATCMRVEDSLARGVSFFMAELQRLKAVVDAARAATDRPVLYLLDEILQGTNTAERQIASRQVLAQLAACNAIGAVSSHDLGLLEGNALEEMAVPVHFAETFRRTPEGPDMTFDYTLRQGLATSSNALALMEVLGFDLPKA
ncbi:MAG: hypothetical protein QM753_09905 [Thermomicrobiales bacterium]